MKKTEFQIKVGAIIQAQYSDEAESEEIYMKEMVENVIKYNDNIKPLNVKITFTNYEAVKTFHYENYKDFEVIAVVAGTADGTPEEVEKGMKLAYGKYLRVVVVE